MNKKELIEKIKKSGLEDHAKVETEGIINQLPDDDYEFILDDEEVDFKKYQHFMTDSRKIRIRFFNDKYSLTQKNMHAQQVIDRLKDLELEQ